MPMYAAPSHYVAGNPASITGKFTAEFLYLAEAQIVFIALEYLGSDPTSSASIPLTSERMNELNALSTIA